MLYLGSAYFLVELLAFVLLGSDDLLCLAFGLIWSVLLASLVLLLPRKVGRWVFGITYYIFTLWTIAQAGYFQVFDKMMWISAILYAGEGAVFLGDVLRSFTPIWWITSALMLVIGYVFIRFYPRNTGKILLRLPYLLLAAVMIVGLFMLPKVLTLRDRNIWGTRSEYGQSSSYRAAYEIMYDAKRVYNMCGVYHLTMRDIWSNTLYPLSGEYRRSVNKQVSEVSEYFAERPEKTENEMTGAFAGKNVVLVLMESIDDWMVTEEETPTLCRLMNEGVNFTNFYTPGYGSARTLNTEFTINTGIYLPTTGRYVFDYVTNSYKQSFASQMTANGYSAEVFHYNEPSFYSRGVFEPAMGYNSYVCYEDYEEDEDALFDDCLLFENEELNGLFFREGATFNTIITRSAHLSYKYNEVLSHYALKKYPDYRGKYASEEEDCARVKAKLVDDMFARLLQELEQKGQLENTVIIAVTDHYTYGYKNMEELLAHSGVDNTLLLEKTPCFVWSADCEAMEVDKVLNTSDFLPTMLNLLGIDSPYQYLGQDAFDPNYEGYAYFPDGSWITAETVCEINDNGDPVLIRSEKFISEEQMQEKTDKILQYINVSNLLLTSDYYKRVR
ncbi:MAG: LTA synthase family protein [Oscillospiraceae bacterium]|nr:LTA synthase family protein [Oscillospiraceae bacterium]